MKDDLSEEINKIIQRLSGGYKQFRGQVKMGRNFRGTILIY